MNGEKNYFPELWDGRIDASVIDDNGNTLLTDVNALIGNITYLPGQVPNDNEAYATEHTRRIRLTSVIDYIPIKQTAAATLIVSTFLGSCHQTNNQEIPAHNHTSVVTTCSKDRTVC